MDAVLTLLNGLLPFAYLVSLAGYGAVFVSDRGPAARWVPRFTWAVVAAHAAYLLVAGVSYEHVPVANVWEALTFVAFALALVHLLLEARLGVRSTGVFVMAGVVVFQTLSSALITHTRDVSEILRSPMFGVHVTAVLVGYVALAMSAIYGGVYLVQHRQLKSRRVGLVFRRLPDLETLSRLNVTALGIGWTSLTVAIAAGSAWAATLQLSGELPGGFLTDPKFLGTVAVWLVYGACLGGVFFRRWGDRRVATTSLVAFAFLLASSLAGSALFSSFHDFS